MIPSVVRAARVLSCSAILLAMSAPASAQVGGFAGYPPPQIVILLGPDYESSKAKPFLDGYELSNDLFLKQNNIHIPVGSVQIDNTTELPTQGGITVQARYPESFSDEEVQSFKNNLKLDALRYGLTNLEFQAMPTEEASIWIRAGLPTGGFQMLEVAKLLAATADLSTFAGGRLEIYDETRFESPLDLADPSEGAPPAAALPTIEDVKASLERSQARQTLLAERIKALVTHFKTTDASRKETLQLQITQEVDQMFQVRHEIQLLELMRMRLKLSATEAMLKARAAQQADLVRRRVESLVQ